jgi:GNAT superfamily N-acetyltransferase
MRGDAATQLAHLEVTADPARIDVELVHGYLSQQSHWARGIDRATVERSLRNSLCFVALRHGAQVGFARVITDRATFAYVCDVFVLPNERRRGAGRQLVEAILAHPDLQGLRRVALNSRDARALYARAGFVALAHPERWMERHVANAYGVAA